MAELMQIARITRGQKVSFVTDISPDAENMGKIVKFVSGSDAVFL